MSEQEYIMYKKSFLTKFEMDEEGSFVGYASGEVYDLAGDKILLDGMITGRAPLNLEHHTTMRIGTVEKVNVKSDNGLKVLEVFGTIDLKGEIPSSISTEQRQIIRQKSKEGKYSLSIGVLYLDTEKTAEGLVVKSSKLVEISMVENPCNKVARIIKQKSIMSPEEKKNLQEVIKTTYKANELNKSLAKLYNIDYKSVNDIYDTHRLFQKRCNDMIQKKNLDIEQQNKARQIELINLVNSKLIKKS
jgi:hypothetical protein